MTITLEVAKNHLQAWLDADLAVSQNQSYQIGVRRLTKADAPQITEKIKYWSNMVEKLQAGGPRVKRVIPRDL